MILERFSTGNSALHAADVKAKLVSAMALTLVLALARDYRSAVGGLILGAILVSLAGQKPGVVIFRLLIVNSFTVFLWLTLPITYPGEPFASLGPFTISHEGVAITTLITLKTNAIILILIALLATSTVADIGRGLEQLGVPVKICLLLLFSYRYIFVIHQEFQRLTRAAKLRAFSPATNLHTYRTYGYLFGMTLIKSWHRADRVSQAMLLRGFDGRFYSLHDGSLRAGDILFGAAMVLIAIGLGCLEVFLY